MDAISSEGGLTIIITRARIESTISREGTHPLALWNGVAQLLVFQLISFALVILAWSRLLQILVGCASFCPGECLIGTVLSYQGVVDSVISGAWVLIEWSRISLCGHRVLWRLQAKLRALVIIAGAWHKLLPDEVGPLRRLPHLVFG